MSATYLTKYAAGIEEHAQVKKTEQREQTLNISVKGIKETAGATLADSSRKDKSKSEQCRLLFPTECVRAMIGPDYVIPTYDRIHVSTVSLEQRGSNVEKRLQRRRVDNSGENRNFC